MNPCDQSIIRLIPGRDGERKIITLRELRVQRAFPLAVTLSLLLCACSDKLDEARTEAAQAQTLLNAGDLPGASAAIARALALRDDQLDILLLDARIKIAMQEYGRALDAYKLVLVFDENNQEALTFLAQASAMSGDKDFARDMIKRALAINPNNAEVLLSRGMMELDEERYDAAIATADKLLTSASNSNGIVLKARALFLKGDREASYRLLREAREKFGADPMTATALLENARAEGDAATMLEQFNFLATVNKQSPDLALDELNTRYKSGDLKGARSQGLRIVRAFGDNPLVMTRLFDLWDEYDPAPLTADEVSNLAGDAQLAARLVIARFFIGHGDLTTAIPLLSNAADPRIFGLMARLQVLRGEAGGQSLAAQILERDKVNCEALTASAEWKLSHGAYASAIIPAQLLATQCVDRIDGYQLLIAAYKKSNQGGAVERVYREAIDLHPQDTALTKSFADWLIGQHRSASAVSAARRLSKAAPARVSAWMTYADVCRRVGDQGCLADAMGGAKAAKTNYSLDPLPGTKRGDAMFGRTWK